MPKDKRKGEKIKVNLCLAIPDVRFQVALNAVRQDSEDYDEFYGLTYGPEEYRRPYEEAYREAFLLGCGEAVFGSMYAQEQAGYAITRPAFMPTIFMVNAWSEIYAEEEAWDRTSHTENVWYMKYSDLVSQMQNVSKVPMTVSSIQAGIAMLTLQREFDSKEHEQAVRSMLRKYSWITRDEAIQILGRWRQANWNLLTMNNIGIYA